MPFYFLQPLYLAALAATSLPILIHLLNRRRLRRIRFPAVQFVLISQRRISRSYRLRHWMILALRTLAILILVLLLAGTVFQSGVGLSAGGGPLSLVIVLDNSLSMKWSGDGKGFDRAKEAARLLLASLRDADQAAIIPTHRQDTKAVRLRSERDAVLKDLDGIRLTAETADFSSSLRKAYELLDRPLAQKAIWLITDLSLTGWDRLTLSAIKQFDPRIPVKIIKVGNGESPLNATISEVRALNNEVAVGLPLRLEAKIINFSGEDINDLPVELRLDDRAVEQRLVNVPAKEELAVSFQVKLARAGAHPGSIALKKTEVAGNPVQYFVLQPQDPIKVLVVDGDPKTSLVRSETFFLSRSLNPTGQPDASVFVPTVIVPEALESVALQDYEAIVLCNLDRIPDAVIPRLTRFLHQGGGLLVFLGDRVQRQEYNRSLFRSSDAPILPAALEERRVLPPAQAQVIKTVDTRHGIFDGFTDPTLKASLESVRVHGYFRIPSSNGSDLLTLANGDPLLVEKKVGLGRLLLFTTAADHDWSDLPFKTAYLPLMQTIIAYLSGDKMGSVDMGTTAGTEKTFSLPPSLVGRNMRIVTPDKLQSEIRLTGKGQSAVATFSDNSLAGIYQSTIPGTQARDVAALATRYAVNPPYLESRLQEIGAEELKTKLGPLDFQIVPFDSLMQGGTQMDLSLPLLFLVMATLATEGWLAQRQYE